MIANAWQRAADWWDEHRWVGRLVAFTVVVAVLAFGVYYNREGVDDNRRAFEHAERALAEVAAERERAVAFDDRRDYDTCLDINEVLADSRNAWEVLRPLVAEEPGAIVVLDQVIAELAPRDCDAELEEAPSVPPSTPLEGD